ncbi:MAG TPA: transglutaminase-like domain-containing protein [Candidatus Sulfotelmatobacter sp.]|jgi:transglutaminase-like putative cysteine protease|nr:transglutaminase-like domain-containing protein [Candidatus Sulfotelmatobacter sp.]
MRLRVLSPLLLLVLAICQLPVQGASKPQKFSPPARTFRFTYNFTVKDIPADAKRVRVWIPLPQTDQHQTVRVLAVKAPVKTEMTQEREYGNRMVYAEIANPATGTAEFTLQYKVTRREYSRGDYAELERRDQKPSVVPASMSRLVAPDTLIPTDGKIKELAVEVTESQTGTVAKAKAAYDYLFTTMRYDKTGTGWGRGDAVWACDAKHGNCTDFHSPFIGMLRADGIPARFDIGFPLPENKDKGEIAGYHCWAEFYASKSGWVPLDISEAWKAKEKQDYFFGSVDANRVQFSTGRDVTLSPKQDGPALNYFVYPYVEVDGKPYEKLDKQFSFEEVKSAE